MVFDQLAMHERDLSGWAAEAEQPDAQEYTDKFGKCRIGTHGHLAKNSRQTATERGNSWAVKA
jgi:hypothetical protein